MQSYIAPWPTGSCEAEAHYIKADILYYNRKYEEAFTLFHQAHLQGWQQAGLDLGKCYYYGRGVSTDRETAVQYLLEAARAPLPYAHYLLSLHYAEQNEPELSAQYCLVAALANVAPAQFRLHKLYEKAEGVPADSKQSLHWLQMAAKNGHPKARQSLREMAMPYLN